MNDPYVEKDPNAEAMQTRLLKAGCTIYRQWGGNNVFAIYMPPPYDPVRIVTKNYADFPDRASARRAGYVEAIKELDRCAT